MLSEVNSVNMFTCCQMELHKNTWSIMKAQSGSKLLRKKSFISAIYRYIILLENVKLNLGISRDLKSLEETLPWYVTCSLEHYSKHNYFLKYIFSFPVHKKFINIHITGQVQATCIWLLKYGTFRYFEWVSMIKKYRHYWESLMHFWMPVLTSLF